MGVSIGGLLSRLLLAVALIGGAVAGRVALRRAMMAPTMRPDARPGVPLRPGEIRGPGLRRFVQAYTLEHQGEPGGAPLDPGVVDGEG